MLCKNAVKEILKNDERGVSVFENQVDETSKKSKGKKKDVE